MLQRYFISEEKDRKLESYFSASSVFPFWEELYTENQSQVSSAYNIVDVHFSLRSLLPEIPLFPCLLVGNYCAVPVFH